MPIGCQLTLVFLFSLSVSTSHVSLSRQIPVTTYTRVQIKIFREDFTEARGWVIFVLLSFITVKIIYNLLPIYLFSGQHHQLAALSESLFYKSLTFVG